MRPLLTHSKLFQDAQLDVEREQKTKMRKKTEGKKREDRERHGSSRRLAGAGCGKGQRMVSQTVSIHYKTWLLLFLNYKNTLTIIKKKNKCHKY